MTLNETHIPHDTVQEPSSTKINALGSNTEDSGPQRTLAARTALILFASETGTAEDAAEALKRLFERQRWHVEVKSMDAVQLVCHVSFYFIVLCNCSTISVFDIKPNSLLCISFMMLELKERLY